MSDKEEGQLRRNVVELGVRLLQDTWWVRRFFEGSEIEGGVRNRRDGHRR
jgi:hypothetical protein